VVIVGLFDFLKTIEVARIDPHWGARDGLDHRLCRCGGVLFHLLLSDVALCAGRRIAPGARR
jgi:hypothetical protein